MSLTVANRIRLGFVSILLMLFFIGGNSLYGFFKVEAETIHSKTIALPALQFSNKLEGQLMIVQRLSLEEYHSTTISDIEKYHADLVTSEETVQTLLQKLTSLSAQDQTIASKLPSLKSAVSTMRSTTSSLYLSKSAVLTLRQDLSDALENLSEMSDELSSNLLDVSDIESDNSQVNELIGIANDLDGLIMTIINTGEDIAKQEDKAKTIAIAKELTFVNDDVNTKLNFLITRGVGIIDAELLETLRANYQDIVPFISGSNSIEAIKLKLLAKTNESSSLSKLTNQQTIEAVVQVEIVLEAASKSAEHSEELILENVNDGKFQTIIVMIIAAFISMFVSYTTVNSISHPLNKINNALGFLAKGDLTHSVEHDTKDEFGELTRNINHLSTSLREVITSIANGSRQLATASDQTSSITQETTQAIAEQQTQVDQAAAAINEMSLSAGQVSENAASALNEVQETNNQAIAIAKVSESNKSVITSLATDISDAAGVINKLHDDSTNIGSIIDVIRGIAEQTNLLALNAAIEAARAGEYGRGFAVVADEVRNLANRTQKSTTEINDMVELIQSGALEAVKVMELSQKEAQGCVSDSEKTSSSLHEMSEALVRVEDKSEQITQAAQEQNVVSNEISQLLESIVEISNNTSNGAEQTAQATIEVANLAVELQTAAANFKI